MAALVQTIPQQTTVTMLHSGPPSPGGFNPIHAQSHHSPRRYHRPSTSSNYRGLSSSAMAPPYAFTSTPQLSTTDPSSRPQPTPYARSDSRSISAPVLPQIPSLASSKSDQKPTQAQGPSTSVWSNPSIFRPLQDTTGTEDNIFPDFSSWPQPKDTVPQPKPQPQPQPQTQTKSPSAVTTSRPAPDRYRRNVRRPDNGVSAGFRPQHHPMAASMPMLPPIYHHPMHANSSPALTSHDRYRGAPFHAQGQAMRSSADDMSLNPPRHQDLVKQYRRRSIGSLETAGLNHSNDSAEHVSPHPNTFLPGSRRTDPQTRELAAQLQKPPPSHQHKASADSVTSVRSNRSSRPGSVNTQRFISGNPTNVWQSKNDRPSSPLGQARSPQVQMASVPQPDAKVLEIPRKPVEPGKRNPSPLSRPLDVTDTSEVPAPNIKTPAATTPPPKPLASAAEHLAAVSRKDEKKRSKLRRAFSFGSATELRKASAQNNYEKAATPVQPSRPSKRNSKYEDELGPEQAQIAENQEAAGLGNSIYSGQGHFFTGSTDNLSISSTASSASIMLRKMGQGVKKSTRSIVGLFRPKSVIGVPAADGPVPQTPAAQVSMVTAEAERQRVNVNVDPHDQPGGGTGFPKLERNSVDAKYSTDSGTASSSRRSIVGGERERAEVLAAVKKGILKRADSGQASPVMRPNDFNLPQLPHVNDSPRSSAPSTPSDDQPPRSGHRRTDSIAIEGGESDDYFSSIAKFTGTESKSVPLTPRAALARNISFSPRIQFHDTWPSGEYDRRGEVATCNRLTPMLAQQIKEELNNFKMVCRAKDRV